MDVTEADISFNEPGEPKTGPRMPPGTRIGRPEADARLRLPPLDDEEHIANQRIDAYLRTVDPNASVGA